MQERLEVNKTVMVLPQSFSGLKNIWTGDTWIDRQTGKRVPQKGVRDLKRHTLYFNLKVINLVSFHPLFLIN